MSRILFYIPAINAPVGGAGVLLEWAAWLGQEGYAVGLFSDEPGQTYPYIAHDLTVGYEPVVKHRKMAWLPLRQRLRTPGYWTPTPSARNVRPDDLIVVPEFAAELIIRSFPENRRVLVVQAQDWLVNGSLTRDYIASNFEAVIATSQICSDAIELLGLPPALRVPLAIDRSLFAFGEAKKQVIAYMPRRRGAEVRLIVDALKMRGKLQDFEFRPLDGMTRAEVAANLRDALVFLAFSQSEGFGLPPAEAMASGCLVIGYTGAGGDEYFDGDVGFPISDGNVGAYVRKVEEVVQRHRADPAALDAMRRRASARILEVYDPAGSRAALLAAFAGIAGEVRAAM
ncbi:glycosyltransferase family 4 protein [Paracoccus zhejiangensis]|uniref:glycosyltransferase family 4 protein n=1 Tax=Paracoccus zhejiangensis TaxID=1077935 RepID=UPI0012FFF043|nr:glycosyltransferase family 4 protein [Paracoccus zhejiangensis]